MNHKEDALRFQIAAISRHRILTDGQGVTTLVVLQGCSMRCKYCINPMTWDQGKGKNYNSEELFEELKKDSLYFLATGGGIVFGGGEPLLQADKIAHFIHTYKETGWKFYLETSLQVSQEKLKLLTGLIDEYIIDCKDMDAQRYLKYTGVPQKNFLDNLHYLLKWENHEKLKVRIPYIEGLHTKEQYQENIMAVKKMGIEKTDEFAYRIN